MSFNDDRMVLPHLVGVLEALAPVLRDRKIPSVCTTTVMPGAVVALDYITDDCDSLAWVRLVNLFPSLSFPSPDQVPEQVLVPAYQIEFGLIRGIELSQDGEPPTVEQQFETTRLQMADMAAMLSVLCSYPDAHDLPVVIGLYQPIGPEGGVVGGTWVATFGTA